MADVAYKRYLIRTNPFSGDVWIEKDKQKITYAKSVEDAKRIIDDYLSESTIKTFSEFVKEDAPANAAGHGNIAGIGVGPKGEPGVDLRKRKKKKQDDEEDITESYDRSRITEDAQPEQIAGADVFQVNRDVWMRSRFGKNRYHRWSRYVGEDETGEAIRQHGKTTKRDIALKDETGAIIFLRRKGLPTT